MEPLLVVPRVTVPLYLLVPVPFLTASHWVSFLPVVASVTTCSSLGVPSACVPVTTVSQARTGLPVDAQTTFRGDLAFSPVVVSGAAFSAEPEAAEGATAASVLLTAIRALVALVTVRVPLAFSWTTRSPPRTGSPA